MIKQIPNIITLLNLFFGCLAIITIMQTGLTVSIDASGEQTIALPQKIYWASVFIGIAAVIDFFDGFFARILKAPSDMGKQLDSLADMVSFGVAPGLIIYQFLRLSFASQVNGLDVTVGWLLPALIIPCAGAYRLARFNIDTTQTNEFKGVPIPAAGLLIASFPLIYWFSNSNWQIQLLQNKWFWYMVICTISYLMISKLPMLALKFKQFSLKNIMPFIIILFVTFISSFWVAWMAIPISFITYVLVSLVFRKKV